MICFGCRFHHGGYVWNRCDLMEAEYYHEANKHNPCAIIDDSYTFITDCPELGFVRGEKAEINEKTIEAYVKMNVFGGRKMLKNF